MSISLEQKAIPHSADFNINRLLTPSPIATVLSLESFSFFLHFSRVSFLTWGLIICPTNFPVKRPSLTSSWLAVK
ncbi:hypothetical protein PNI0006_01175 [Streptococcus pneumoniae PNI0006]|nr:hypothetical protein PNI0006_01175 [Streptococcus pneumoniae PNI0006]